MEYKDFFEKVSGFLKQAEKHKRRGNNDFNPYLEMRSESDEVYLHSALISGFLDPKNNHYQGDVFLETFLECVGLKEWFGDTSNAEVYKESQYIDIYITNGNKHIIIENKILAGDQPQQIQRYIDKIVKDQSLESSKNVTPQELSEVYKHIAVLYLAPYEREPSKSSLGKWQIQEDCLVDNKGNKVRFKAITYENEIPKWIEKSIAKVGCITHLNSALYFYKDVVQIITNTKENTMSVANFLTKNKENMDIVFEILENQNKIMKSYCEAFVEKHREQIESKGFEIFIDKEWRLYYTDYNLVIRPKERNKVYMAFCVREYEGKLYHSIELFCPYNEEKHSVKKEWVKHNNEVIDKMSKHGGMEFRTKQWFDLYWTDNFSTFEKELQRFLDNKEQKKWNEQIEKALQNGLSKIIQGADKD